MIAVYILAAIFIFGMLIAVHELGHFLAAKLCGVQVNEFSVGMGPLLWHSSGGETQYSLRLLPIGGYCSMEGEEEESDCPRALNRQGFFKKLLIFSAGALMNFLTGLILIALLYTGSTAFYTDQLVGFAEGFPLQGEQGLMEGDLVYSVDGYRTYLSGDTQLYLSYNQGNGVDLVVLRNGEKIALKDFPMTRRTYQGLDGEEYTGFDIFVGEHVIPATLRTRLAYTWYTALDFVELVRFSLVQLVTGHASLDDIGGPIAIVVTITEAGTTAETHAIALQRITYLAALIAVNLAVMNLLPIPALDGGHIFFLALDTLSQKLLHRHIPPKFEAAVNMAGMALLLGFMIFISLHDISSRFFQ